jgi:hypothetical protein
VFIPINIFKYGGQVCVRREMVENMLKYAHKNILTLYCLYIENILILYSLFFIMSSKYLEDERQV